MSGPPRNAVLVLVVGLVAGVCVYLVGLDPPDADIKYDWLSAWGSLNSNAHDDVLELGREAGVTVYVHAPPGVEPPLRHPRTPGAILLSLPLLLVPYQLLFAVSVAFGMSVVGWIVLTSTGHLISRTQKLILTLCTLVSAPVFITLRFAGQSAVLALAILVGWRRYRAGKETSGGILIGIAGTMKVFPFALSVPMFVSRRARPLLAVAGSSLVFNAAGLALPGVNLPDTISAISGAASSWVSLISNASLIRLFHDAGLTLIAAQALSVALVIVGIILLNRFKSDRIMADPLPWLLIGLLVIPLSWVSYDIVLIGAAMVMAVSAVREVRWAAASVWVLWVVPTIVIWFGVAELGFLGLVARMILLLGWSFGWVGWQDGPNGWFSLSPGTPNSAKVSPNQIRLNTDEDL